jgi:NitT/TauT family transport system substrate-binding protein
MDDLYKRTSSMAVMLVAIFLTLSCPNLVNAQATPVPIKVGLVPNDDVAPLLYAIKSGMFKRVGLDVEIESGSSGGAITQAVLGGSYQIGKSSIPPLLNAHLRGVPLYLIAAGGIYDSAAPYALLVVAPDSPINDPKDLDGQVVGCTALTGLDVLGINGYVDDHGGDSKTIKYVELPLAEATAAIGQRRIVAYTLFEPQLADALGSKKVRILGKAYDSIAKRFLIDGWFVAGPWADAHSDAVRKFTTVIYQAAAYTNQHHDATVGMIADLTKIPIDTIRHMTRINVSTSLDPAQIQPVIDAAAKYHMISKSFPAKELFWH